MSGLSVKQAVKPPMDRDFAVCDAVYHTGGNLVYRDATGGKCTLVGMMGGIWHPIEAKRIISEGTTAENIMVGYRGQIDGG